MSSVVVVVLKRQMLHILHLRSQAAVRRSLKKTHGRRKNTSTTPWPQHLVVDEGYWSISALGSPYVKGLLVHCVAVEKCDAVPYLTHRCHCLIYQVHLAAERQQ